MSMFLNTSKFTHGRRAAKKVMSMQSWYEIRCNFSFFIMWYLQYLYCIFQLKVQIVKLENTIKYK